MLLRSFVAACSSLLLAISVAWGVEAPETVPTHFQNWSTRDGLPSDRIDRVIRTQDGFIWVATNAGAARFDGISFKTYGPREGLQAPTVLSLLEVEPGTLWIGTLGGGLSVLKNGVIERTYTKEDGLPSNWIQDLTRDAEGRLLVATPNGLALFENGHFVKPPENATTPAAIPRVKDRQGTLWGTSGPYLYKWKNSRWIQDPDDPKTIRDMCLDPQGDVWACNENKLWHHTENGWTSHETPESFVKNAPSSSIAAAPDGTIWITHHRRTLYGFRNGHFFTPAPSPLFQPDYAERVMSTSDGQVWMTSAKGLFRLSQSRIRVSLIDTPGAMRVANDLGGLLEIAPGEFLVATQGHGYYRWKDDHATRLSEGPELSSGIYGNTIYRSSDETIWLGGTKGLFAWKEEQPIVPQELPASSGSVWSVEEAHDGALWVGTGYGRLISIKNGQAETVKYGGGKEPIRVIAEEKDGTLWLGTRGNGLFCRKAGIWKRYGRDFGLQSEIIRTLYIDPQGRLWIGTDGGGVSLRSGDHFITITTRDGLPGDSISQLKLDDESRLWIGTHRGLAVLSKESVQEITEGKVHDFHPLLINRSDGLISEEFNIVPPVKTSDGDFAFATSHGFIRLKPSDFQPNTERPPVFLERLLADGSPIPLTGGKISLPAGTKRIEFEFTGLFFSAPERLEFRNRLVGLESDWVDSAARRSTEYRNLLPGHYRFEVEATTGNNLWSEHPASIEVFITPHFWQTLWFRLSLIVLGIGSIAFLVRHQERKRSRRKIEALERQQAVDAERARIARDLHDDVGASLTQVALQSQIAERNFTRKPERAQESLKEIFKTAKEMTRSLDEIVWAVNPTNDTLENFISFLGVFVQDYAKGAGLRCRFDLPEFVPHAMMSPTLRHHLYLATKEILHNIVKHAKASEVVLRISLEPNTCTIILHDNGCGFVESPTAVGADGLINLQNRLSQVRGECIRHSVPGEGTSVEMRIPLDG